MTQPVNPVFEQMRAALAGLQFQGQAPANAQPMAPPAPAAPAVPAAPPGFPALPPGYIVPQAPQQPPPGYIVPQAPVQAPAYPPPGYQAPYATQATQQSNFVPPPPAQGVDFSGVRAQAVRFPRLGIGRFELEVEETRELANPNGINWRATVKILKTSDPVLHPEGSQAVIMNPLSSVKARNISYRNIKSFTIAAVGAPSEAAFDQAFANGAGDALCKATFSAETQLVPQWPANPLAGRRLGAVVTPKGSVDNNGQDWGNYSFFPAGANG